MINVYIPLYNNAQWCKDLILQDGLKYIASDNCSTDGSGAILKSKGVEVITQDTNLGRVGNWDFCVNHFLRGPAAWMRWLFTGDEIMPGSLRQLQKALLFYPAAKIIVGQYYHVENNRETLMDAFPETRVVSPQESFYYAAEKGNVFPFQAIFIHRDALADGFDFGQRPFVADMQFSVSIAKRHAFVYLAEPVAKFNADARKYFLAHRYSPDSLVEGYCIRQELALEYKRSSNDAEKYEKLVSVINSSYHAAILTSILMQDKTGAQTENVVHTVMNNDVAREQAKRMLSAKELIAMIGKKITSKIKKILG